MPVKGALNIDIIAVKLQSRLDACTDNCRTDDIRRHATLVEKVNT